jgi:hypothetical protein
MTVTDSPNETNTYKDRHMESIKLSVEGLEIAIDPKVEKRLKMK